MSKCLRTLAIIEKKLKKRLFIQAIYRYSMAFLAIRVQPWKDNTSLNRVKIDKESSSTIIGKILSSSKGIVSV